MKMTKKIFLLLLTITCTSFYINVNAENEALEKLNKALKKKDYKKRKAYSKYKFLKDKEKFEEKKRKRIIELIAEKTALNDKFPTPQDKESKEYKDSLKKIDTKINEYENMDGNRGDIISAGLAGKYTKYVDLEPKGNDMVAGAEQGLTLLVLGSVSDAAGDIIEKSSKRGLNWFFNNIEYLLIKSYQIMFKHGKKPFAENEIKAWQYLVIEELKNLEDIVKNAEKNSTHSLEEKLREFEAQDAQDKANQEVMLNLWQDYIQDFADTCQELAATIKSRTDYYGKTDDGFGIKSCAARLINKLLKLSKWSLSVKSAKDFAALSEIKTIMVAMKKSVDNYFKNLISQIKPDAKVSSSTSSSSRSWRDKDDDKF